jgi:hypothetical protein
MDNLLNWLKAAWASKSPLRHAVFAFLAVQLAPVLTQAYEWAVSGASLPDWHTAAGSFGKAVVGALLAGLLRWLQLQAIPRGTTGSVTPAT